MHPQIIQDSKGNQAGVFIPIDDWNLIKENYPDIEDLDNEIPDWHKKLLSERLAAIEADPSRVKPIEELFVELRK